MSNKLVILFLSLILFQDCISQKLFHIESLNINTGSFSEISPSFYKEGLLFSSNKKHPFLKTYKDTSGNFTYKVYYTSKKKEKWRLPSLFKLKINKPQNIACASFAEDINLLFFSANIKETKKSGNDFSDSNNVAIFYLKYNSDRNNFSELKKAEFCKDAYNYSHPTYNDNKLFFSSNRNGSTPDIYFVEYNNGKWSEIIELPEYINTEKNEYFPYYINKRLFFSSDREGGFGGLDIYYSDFENGSWTKPILMPSGINSKFNDFSIITDSMFLNGYFVSNRNGSDDIFKFEQNIPVFRNCDSLEINNYCYIFYEEGNYDLDTLPMKYEWDIAGLKRIEGKEAEFCFPGPGIYKIKLNIIDTTTNDIFYTESSYDFKLKDIEQAYIECPDTFKSGEEILFSAKKTNITDFEPVNFYWDFGDGTNSTGVDTKHIYINNGHYTVQLGVSNKGNIKKQCVIKNIYISDKHHLVDNKSKTKIVNKENYIEDDIKKYGEDDIIEDKIYKVEVKRSKEKMSLEDEYFDALRSIYKVMENYVNSDSSYSYTVGSDESLKKTYPVYMKVKNMGYLNAEVKSFDIVPDSISVSDSIAKILLNKLLSQWTDIHFDFNEHKISKKSYGMLIKVFNVLNKYNTLEIEIAAHTDNVGSEEYNMELSEKRAQAVNDFLVKKGINPKRLKPKGYGKTKPLSDNRTEEGRAKNRRVEFIVIKTF